MQRAMGRQMLERTYWRRTALVIPVAVLAFALSLIVGMTCHAADHRIKIARSDCDRLVDYAPPPDVFYHPGVDVRGRPVAPADLDGGWQMQLPQYVSIDITHDIINQSSLPVDSPLFRAEAFIGVVDIDLRDGHVRFNGADLGDPETRALAAACRSAERRR